MFKLVIKFCLLYCTVYLFTYLYCFIFQILVASVCVAVALGQAEQTAEQTAETLKFESVSSVNIFYYYGLLYNSLLFDFQDNNPDGTYAFSYETSNGIAGQESGVGGVSATGEAKWVADDGTPIQFSYVANEGGFQPTGDHIPQAPPHIARLIEWLEAHPSDDDGSYKP